MSRPSTAISTTTRQEPDDQDKEKGPLRARFLCHSGAQAVAERATALLGSILTPGDIVEASEMLRKYVPLEV